MGDILQYAGLAIAALIVGGWVVGAAMGVLSMRKRPVWKFSLSLAAGTLMTVGIAGFCGQGVLDAFGNWLPDSVEWPVGFGEGIAVASNGDHVVPLVAINRIQLYDANWHFIRGWPADDGKGLKVYALPGNRIGAVAQGYEIFTSHGDLLRKGMFPSVAANIAVYNKIPDGISHWVPTPLWLWPLAGPFASWITAIIGLLLLMATTGGFGGWKRKPATGNPAGGIAVKETLVQQASDTPDVLTHSFPTEPPKFIAWVREQGTSATGGQGSVGPGLEEYQTACPAGDERLMAQVREFLGQPRYRDYAWLASSAIWTMGWLLVAGTAVGRALRFPAPVSIVGMCAAVGPVLWGLRTTLRATRPRPRFVSNPQPKGGSGAKRLGRAIAAVIWCAVGFAWNVVIFSMLILEAWKGRGWLLVFLLPWSLIGLFLLLIISSSIGIMTEGKGRALRTGN